MADLITPAADSWLYSPSPAVEKKLLTLKQKYPSRFAESLDSTYAFLKQLGDPQNSLPFVFHVAGTNGKGSTLAFIQAILESGGKTVHKFIGPHLVRFEERITLNSKMIGEKAFLDLMEECEKAAEKCAFVSFFEFFTGLALLAFARNPADAVLLETGTGGLLDATNVIQKNIVSLITRISKDHTHVLGKTLDRIAEHKAGIIKKDCPVIIAPQEEIVTGILLDRARDAAAPVFLAGQDWTVKKLENSFLYKDRAQSFILPMPVLKGDHQLINAGCAMAAVRESPFQDLLQKAVLQKAMQNVSWPGRLQQLTKGKWAELLTDGWELWIDGAHNDSGAAALAAYVQTWGNDKPVHIITCLKSTKDVQDFYKHMIPGTHSFQTIDVPAETPMIKKDALAKLLSEMGAKNAAPAENLESAVKNLVFSHKTPQRILITGSLYLMGRILKENMA